MEWSKSVLVMLIGSIILGFFITSSLMVNKTSDIKMSLTKFYQALWMGLWMVLLELAMYPDAPPAVYIATFVAIVIVFYLARRQVFVGDREYLRAMIQHHSSAIVTSDEIVKKTTDDKVRKFADWISKTQQEEIDYMNEMLSTMS